MKNKKIDNMMFTNKYSSPKHCRAKFIFEINNNNKIKKINKENNNYFNDKMSINSNVSKKSYLTNYNKINIFQIEKK